MSLSESDPKNAADPEADATQQQIADFWDRAGRSSKLGKILKFGLLIAQHRRLPVRGWVRAVIRSQATPSGWWHNPAVVRRVNERICGRPVDGRDQGLIDWLIDTHGDLLPLDRGVSVGCGSGTREMALLQAGVVDRFDLYELSPVRIEEGEQVAKQRGLADRVSFHQADAFAVADQPEAYDLVTWCDALHHMPDVETALEWSRRVLEVGGILLLSDYVGATRFQWPDRQLDMAGAVRGALDEKYLVLPHHPFTRPSTQAERPTVEQMIAMDPSEAWDSGNIVPALERHFPEADCRKTGGVIYHLALNAEIQNFHPHRDRALIELLMVCDRLCMDAGEDHYMAAIARKQGNPG